MSSPGERYRGQEALAAAEAAELEARVQRTSRWRIAAFFAAVTPFLLLEFVPDGVWPLLIGFGILSGLVFLALVRRHGIVRRSRDRARLREAMNREALARLSRRWDELPPAPVLAAPDEHPCAADLDLVGRASIAHLLGRVRTAPGRAFLEQVLLDPFRPLPADATELLARLRSTSRPPVPSPGPEWWAGIRRRQEAVELLAGEPEMRERLELLAREHPKGGIDHDTAVFLEWLTEPSWLREHGGFRAAGRFLGVFTPLTLVTWLLGWTPGFLPALGALGAVALHRKFASEADRRLSAAEAGEGDLSAWSNQLELVRDLPAGNAVLDRLKQGVLEPEPGAAGAIRKLVRITDTAGVRRSSLAHFPLVALFSWDVHMLDWLERWQSRYGHAARSWVRHLGELELFSALAGLRHDHPEWAFPLFSDDVAGGIRARALGHPLLDPASCVPNDVEVPSPGKLLLVTGSNMAGKTTLLRAIGANQILALAGAPVASKELHTVPRIPWCAMRVHDSLEGGVSYFLAELQRLKRVVDAARAAPTLYLLDEILQGTNSEERQTAARIVLSQLLETRSIGAITTHDLTLAASDELEKRSVNVHFREEVTTTNGKKALEFDYRLRPGTATSRNALLLLEIVGLGPPTG